MKRDLVSHPKLGVDDTFAQSTKVSMIYVDWWIIEQHKRTKT